MPGIRIRIIVRDDSALSDFLIDELDGRRCVCVCVCVSVLGFLKG